MSAGKIIFLTGERDSGKTLVCERVIDMLSGASNSITGIVSPGRYENGKKTGIFCINIANREKRLLAYLSPGWDSINPERDWQFSQEALIWGNKLLGRSVPTDLLVIDELGFLEFENNEGWTNGLGAIDSGKYQYALIVVRPTLIKKALDRFPDARFITISSPEDREIAVYELVSHFSAVR